MMYDVFISYSIEDQAAAEKICAALESKKMRCWIAPRDVLPGAEWAEAIVDAIDASHLMLLVFSTSSNNSRQVIREIGMAASKGIPIVPVRIDDVSTSKSMQYFISSHHWLEAQTPPLEKHLRRIAESVQKHLTQTGETEKIELVPEEKPKLKTPAIARPGKPKTGAEKSLVKRPWVWAVGIILLAAITSLIVVNQVPSHQPTMPSTPIVDPKSVPSPPSTSEEGRVSPTDEGILCLDDFSDPNSGWRRTSSEDIDCDYIDGEYHIQVKKSNWATWSWSTIAGQLTNFALELDARLVSGQKENSYGLIFRVQDDKNYYRFLISGDGYYLIGTRLNGTWTVLQSKTKSPVIKGDNSTNHLKVICQGSQIKAYANGHLLTTVTDDLFAEGYIGMIVDVSSGRGHAAFDNLKVHELDSEVVKPPATTTPTIPPGTAVTFPDPNLRSTIRQEINKPEGPITIADLESLTTLSAQDRNITDLTGLELCKNLESLYLQQNNITDISSLAGLIKLEELRLGNNSISDISPLSELVNLRILYLLMNHIKDISPLSGLTNMEELLLGSNNISDISPLSELVNLRMLYLLNNYFRDISPLVQNSGLSEGDTVNIMGAPLNATSANIYIPRLEQRGVKVIR